jgi:tRNA dimethylallyltransferase
LKKYLKDVKGDYLVLIPHSPRLLILVGATGVGKTQLALKLAHIWGAEIISADSMQVYRYMNIGTAKPGNIERQSIPHYLIDVVDPDEVFNVSLYINLARRIMAAPGNSKKLFIVVGGTGLYIRALLGGLVAGTGADRELRDYLRTQLKVFGRDRLYAILKEKDALAADLIDPHDTSRIIRAIEVRSQSGKSIVEIQKEHNFRERPYHYLKVGLRMERKQLYGRIERRAENMIAGGFVEEVQWLLEQGYHESLKSMQSLGYRHLSDYLRGGCRLEEAVDTMKRDTRQYAKRQETWFKADPEINWFSYDDFSSLSQLVEEFMTKAKEEQVIE